MAIERARAQAVQKPWGVADLRPWSRAHHDGGRLIGEIWYERSGSKSDSSLLPKLLFTSQPLSIQVHPDDAYAQSIATGDAVFAQSDSVDIRAGPEGMVGLVAYTGVGGPVPRLLQGPAQPSVGDAAPLEGRQVPTSLLHTKTDPEHGLAGATP